VFYSWINRVRQDNFEILFGIELCFNVQCDTLEEDIEMTRVGKEHYSRTLINKINMETIYVGSSTDIPWQFY
jgi:hypothetical protein